MTQQNDDINRLIQEAKEQIERKEYLLAINNLNYIIENSARDGYVFFLRGKAYSGLTQYQAALVDLEKALDIYRETDNKREQIYTLIELAFVYPFNGKVREGFLAQQQTIKIAKELELQENDSLYSYVSHVSQISNYSLEKMESKLQNVGSIPSWDKFDFMGRMMGYATKGKIQSYIFILVWLLMAVPTFILGILTSPIWLPVMIYQTWQRTRNNE
ncbi:hypothetical protein H1P_1690006 [Hyella patelloides LEGE 07179]|uniref:Tetratricopeptide repeat protein n=1 Tax=Hyella patelloides LEGE 07179 TaxID=945734 RepID=A0A563VNC0_9CYAN|nr:hypothetical protein [Hyella patelloides]VEP12857.1 hypothetical protein H1P_1690006 [Hyella patelloides LEGE 07179]